MLNTTQALALAQILRARQIDGARVARLAMGAAPYRIGDYDLLLEAAFAASSSRVARTVECDDLYEILCAAAQDAAAVTNDWGMWDRSERVVPLP